jgi:outer membrane protein
MRLAFSILLLSLSLPAAASGLSEIYQQAREHDAQFAAAREAYRAGQEKLPQALATARPQVTLAANRRANRDHSSQTNDTSSYGSSSTTLSISQTVLNLQKVQAIAQGELQVDLAETQFRQAEQDLMLRVAKAYFDAVQAEEVLAAVQAQKQAFGEQLASTRRGLELGTVAITDVNEAQTKVDLATAQEIASTNDLEVKRHALERIIEGPLPPLARFDPTQRIVTPKPDELPVLLQHAASDNLSVAVARLNRELAQREAAKQDVAAAPTVEATFSVNSSRSVSTPGIVQRYNTWQAAGGLELSWPLVQGGGVSSRQREAAANLSKAGFDLDNAQRQAALDVRQAWLNAASGAAQVSALEQALKSAEVQVNSTRKGLAVGVRSRLDVLNAEQQLYATQRDLANARYTTLTSSLQLKAAANTLTEQDLRALDAWLKP